MFSRIIYNKDISDVSGKIKHALLSPLPRRRYIVGKDAFVWVLLSHLPTLVTDFILGVHLPPLRPKINDIWMNHVISYGIVLYKKDMIHK